MIKGLTDITKNLNILREQGVQKGDPTGFKCLDEFYSVKPGTFTIILGSPTHGKSELIFELILNQIEKGKKALILSPETGNAEEIYMELIHKYLKKSPYVTAYNPCTDLEFETAKNHIDHFIRIADDEDNGYSFQRLADSILDYERSEDIFFDLVMAEPWNELDHKQSLMDNAGRQDLSIEDELSHLRRFCKKYNKHFFLSFHPAMQALVRDDNSGMAYYPMPKAREAAGGQATLRKAFNWINVWRPPTGLLNPETGIPYQDNELILVIEKTKPKGVGKKGKCTLYFDWQKNRYYETEMGNKFYAYEHKEPPKLHPDTFIMPISNQFETEDLF